MIGFLVFCIIQVFAQSDVTQRSLQAEVSRLENLRYQGKLNSRNKTKLAEIYFLTSRCDDIRTLFQFKPSEKLSQTDQVLLCACGQGCSMQDEKAFQLQSFRKSIEALESGKKRWSDPSIQNTWIQVSQMPEAKYWLLKAIHKNPGALADPKLKSLKPDLERSLESLEVQQ